MPDGELLKLCDLWERQRRGNNAGVYLVGALGGAKVLLFRRHNPDPDGPHWSLFLAERKPREQQQPSPKPRGQGAWDAVRAATPDVSPGERNPATQAEPAMTSAREREAYQQELAGQFAPDDEPGF